MARSFSERVYDMVRRVPYGKVASYGGIAALLGTPRAARGVGRALHALPDGSDVPWWRIINGRGEISIRGFVHGPQLQRALLEDEGVEFDQEGRTDFQRFGWEPQDAGSR
ncbi:MAG TPA: MGMT family protein [Longimicrobiales bacterium]|nr:MGMT family protein [Longimicrobiales bacterium]